MSPQPVRSDKLFGTDGIRGAPGIYPLTDDMIGMIGGGIARYALNRAKTGPANTRIIIGKDTRLSGGHIETTLAKSITACGVNVSLVGIITTPGLSYMTKTCGGGMGMMISASHNKASDNGIKFFNAHGHKLSESEEAAIEDIIFDSIAQNTPCRRRGRKGRSTTVKTAQARYLKFLVSTMKGFSLKGMRIALDCAWGAAAPFAAKVFTNLGARVHAIHDKPSGDAINEGGAINPAILKDLVLSTKADIGVAVDGDGDRGILVDETGTVLDGDRVLAIIAGFLLEKNKLPKKTVVATVMSNYGLKMSIEARGGKIITTGVGDKYVLQALLKHNLRLGGEQSGHVIFLDYLSTPDGLLTALQILKVMKERGAKLSQLAACMTKYPQTLVNIRVRERRPFEEMPAVSRMLQDYNVRLKNQGRILLRYSGTEFLARVMVEGRDKELITEIADSLAGEIKKHIGA